MTEAAQLDAILHGTAFAAITDRAFLRVTGSDATRWLNGMVTNNIAALAPGEGNYNFLLNAQGRIQGDCTIYREPGHGPATYLLETQNSQLETIQKTLDHFIIMDDVELEAVRPRNRFVVLGPLVPTLLLSVGDAAVDLAKLADSAPPVMLSFLNGAENWFYERVGTVPKFAWDSLLGLEGSILHDLRVRGAVEVSPETLEAFRIYSGTPQFGTDIRERDLPQETGQTHALHFAKGCYLGQEIVERIRSRGQVHRQFTQFTLTGELPALPATLEANGKPAGELTSAAHIGDTIYALGYARREALDTHQPLTYPGGTALATGN